MNEVSSFVFKKFRSILVGMWRKVVFGDKNPDLCCDDKKKNGFDNRKIKSFFLYVLKE